MRAAALVRLTLLLAIAPVAHARFEGKARFYDFDGDGRHDLLFVGQPGTAGDRLLKIVRGAQAGSTFASAISRTAGGALRLADAGDVDGDGRDDLVLQGLPLGPASGVIRVDLTDGATVVGHRYLPDGGGAWTVRGVGDTNGDGAQEILAEAGPAIGQARIQRPLANGGIEQGFAPTAGGAWRLFGSTDLDGDGREELVFAGADGSPAAGHYRFDFLAADGLTLVRRDFAFGGSQSLEPRGVGPGLLVVHLAFDDPYQELRRVFRFGASGSIAASFDSLVSPSHDLPDFGHLPIEGASGAWATWRDFVDLDDPLALGSPPALAPLFDPCVVPGGGAYGWQRFTWGDFDGDGHLDLPIRSARSTPVVLANGAGAWEPFGYPR